MTTRTELAATLHLALLAALFMAQTGAVATAGEIYRETDADGNVIYSDRPSDASADRLRIRTAPTDPAEVAASAEARAAREAARAESQQNAREAAEQQADIARQRAENCEKAKAYRQRVETAHRLYDVDDEGNRSYYSAEQHDAALEKARAQVEEWCDTA